MTKYPKIFQSLDRGRLNVPAGAIDFFDVVKREAAVLDKRRCALARQRGESCEDAWRIQVVPMRDTDGARILDDRNGAVPEMCSSHALTGLSLSGGGVRSAAFSLGVLQGLDAAVPDSVQPQVLHAIDYLSTVSGGGYTGASLAAGLLSGDGTFPFTSKLDGWETDGTQHLRDYSNYLVPRGPMDWVIGAVVLLRGLLINALLFLGLVLLACSVTAMLNRTEDRLGQSWIPFLQWVHVPFVWTAMVLVAFIVVQLPPIAGRLGLLPTAAESLDDREKIGTRLAWFLLAVVAISAFDVQTVLLRGMFDAYHLTSCHRPVGLEQIAACVSARERAGWLGRALYRAGLGSGAPWLVLSGALGTIGAFGEKLVKLARTSVGDHSWPGLVRYWSSHVIIAAGALVVPLALWITYLSFSFAAIRCTQWAHAPACSDPTHPSNIPFWLGWIGQPHLALAYAFTGFAFLLACLLVPTNANSLHGYYRDRLSRAFLGHAADYAVPSSVTAEPPETATFDPDHLKLSSMVGGGAFSPQRTGTGGWSLKAESTPYLLVNAAVNLEASPYTNRRGRNADSFIIAPLCCGSAATGYAETVALEEQDRNLNLATAMAISGAAASANMGSNTIRALTFSLAALNVRLGYWLPNPARVRPQGGRPRGWETLWPAAFLLEAFGLLDEKRPLVYLTDGGHFDNLGIYELLKRGCRVIIAADAEADPPMNFESLVRLERCARIDLGVRIDLPWERLRLWSRGVTNDSPHGPSGDESACNGPHVALGRIDYGHGEPGLLIYIKACITGDENDLIRDYRRRNPSFPHETTLDQFFTEEQFEVYRALGFHATLSFFAGKDRFGLHPAHADRRWTGLVRRALKRLNIPDDAIDRIALRQAGGETVGPDDPAPRFTR